MGHITHTGEMKDMDRILIRKIFTEVPGLDEAVFKVDLKMKLDDRFEWSNLAQIGSTDELVSLLHTTAASTTRLTPDAVLYSLFS